MVCVFRARTPPTRPERYVECDEEWAALLAEVDVDTELWDPLLANMESGSYRVAPAI